MLTLRIADTGYFVHIQPSVGQERCQTPDVERTHLHAFYQHTWDALRVLDMSAHAGFNLHVNHG